MPVIFESCMFVSMYPISANPLLSVGALSFFTLCIIISRGIVVDSVLHIRCNPVVRFPYSIIAWCHSRSAVSLLSWHIFVDFACWQSCWPRYISIRLFRNFPALFSILPRCVSNFEITNSCSLTIWVTPMPFVVLYSIVALWCIFPYLCLMLILLILILLVCVFSLLLLSVFVPPPVS